jgi:hypothetical protein
MHVATLALEFGDMSIYIGFVDDNTIKVRPGQNLRVPGV